ncbi:type I DNA topoisomerase, partial [Magnetococcales bacterium HHB-1]
MKAIIIVESPAKAKTINKFLGAEYKVMATYGHVRDLPKKNGSVEPDNQFHMKYQITERAQKRVKELTQEAKDADLLLLATDPDREGEAISWHVQEILQKKKELANIPIKRVIFHEITQKAIQEAVSNPRDVDMDMVNAQQARRALDYLVGFNLSPLLWKKIRRGLSAGRVQSVALRLVCEREKEINEFKPREYWSIFVHTQKEDPQFAKSPFQARLVTAEGKNLKKFDIPNEERAKALVAAIENQPLFLADLQQKQVRRNPAPPFITSTLQQEASRKLRFSAKKTMMVAQKLYEGLEVPVEGGGKEVVGLITYMRTDSVNLADEAIKSIRGLVRERYGKEYLPARARRFKSSSKNAQEAHEAIRPTDPQRHPQMLVGVLEKDMLNLYDLIWKRAIASQMAAAKINQVRATISVSELNPKAAFLLRATGSSVAFDGFRKIYNEGTDEVSIQDRDPDAANTMLPPLEKGETLLNKEIKSNQHFTE